ncbi:hypothetical protein MOTC310_14405 [Methylobacterium oryzae]|uniref:Methyl-accepting chemotaxis protein n=1 Tax=Methylobacterium oryzae TaxID=334852 RepID=A0ABU7TP75_9HYPH
MMTVPNRKHASIPAAADSSGPVSDAVTGNIAGAAQASEETGAAASQVLSTAAELSRQSEHLGAEVARFLAAVRSARQGPGRDPPAPAPAARHGPNGPAARGSRCRARAGLPGPGVPQVQDCGERLRALSRASEAAVDRPDRSLGEPGPEDRGTGDTLRHLPGFPRGLPDRPQHLPLGAGPRECAPHRWGWAVTSRDGRPGRAVAHLRRPVPDLASRPRPRSGPGASAPVRRASARGDAGLRAHRSAHHRCCGRPVLDSIACGCGRLRR